MIPWGTWRSAKNEPNLVAESAATAPVLATNEATASQPSGNERFKPVSVARVVVAEKDEGLVLGDDGRPMRKVRYRYIDHGNWQDPARGVSVGVARPKEGIVLVSMETN